MKLNQTTIFLLLLLLSACNVLGGGSKGSEINDAFRPGLQDTTAPTAPAWGASYSASTSQTPVFSWAAATDTHSSISTYMVALGTTAGGNDVVDWTSVGNVVSYTFTGLTLTDGADYYASVKAVNDAGIWSTAANSGAFRVDVTIPSAPGSPAWASTVWGYTATTPALSWNASSDTGSGISHYQVALGTAAGATNVVTWTSVGNVTSYSFSGLTLTNGTSYYATVRAVDTAGNISTAANTSGGSAAFTVDNVAPNAPTALLDGSVTTSTTAAPTVSWTASTSSAGSNFGGYELALGTTQGGTDILTWTDIGNVTSYTPSVGFTLINGSVYFASVRTYKTTGLRSSAANGDGFAVVTAAASPNFKCDFTTSTDCYADPYASIARPLIRFSRASGANTSPGTYFDSTGVMRTAGRNYFSMSQTFTSNWSLFNASAVGNIAAPLAPDGTATATSITESGGTTSHRIELNIGSQSVTSTWTCSVYMHAEARTQGYLKVWDSNASANFYYSYFDLSAGTVLAGQTGVGGTGTFQTSRVSSAGNGWYRVSVTGVLNSGGTTGVPVCSIQGASAASTSYASDGNIGFDLWGAQMEVGSAPTSYIYTNGAAAYAPRIDHDPTNCSGGVCAAKGLLIEEARKNVFTSSTYSITANTGGNASTVASAVLAPDGTTAVKLLDNTANNRHYVPKFATLVANNAYSYSIYLKAGELTSALVYGGKSGSPYSRGGMIVNLTNGTFTDSNAGAAALVTNKSVTAVGNGWYRVAMTVKIDATSTDGYFEVNTVQGTSTTTYVGTGTDGIYLWGPQIELGAYATSYIPTTAGGLTRNADIVTVPSFTDWFDPTKGALWISARATQLVTSGNGFFNQGLMEFHDGTANNRIIARFRNEATGSVQAGAQNGGVSQYSLSSTGGATANTSAGFAYAYANNDFAMAALGQAASTANTGSNPVVSACTIGSNFDNTEALNGTVKFIKYFNVRLNDSQLKYMSAP